MIAVAVILVAGTIGWRLLHPPQTGQLSALPNLQGELQTIDFRDKPTGIVFFTSWCPYCNQEAADLLAVAQLYKERVQFYGVNLENRDTAEDVDKYVRKYGIDYPILLDAGSSVYESFGAPGFPTIVFFDENGKETKRLVGAGDRKTIEAMFRKAAKL